MNARSLILLGFGFTCDEGNVGAAVRTRARFSAFSLERALFLFRTSTLSVPLTSRLTPPSLPRVCTAQEHAAREPYCRTGKSGAFLLTESQQAQGLF